MYKAIASHPLIDSFHISAAHFVLGELPVLVSALRLYMWQKGTSESLLWENPFKYCRRERINICSK
jgi:hypothetical protein